MDSRSVSEQQLQNPEIMNFAKFTIKFELSDKSMFKLTVTRKYRQVPALWPTSIPKLTMTSMVWNTSTGQLGYLSGHAPSQLLHTCSLGEHEKLGKVLDFTATTENINVNNILLILIQNTTDTGRKTDCIAHETRTAALGPLIIWTIFQWF